LFSISPCKSTSVVNLICCAYTRFLRSVFTGLVRSSLIVFVRSLPSSVPPW
jgi:hypothetical protein